MEFSKGELAEAMRQIDSILHKLRAAVKTLEAKEGAGRYRPQMTLAARRIKALEIARHLIGREIDAQ